MTRIALVVTYLAGAAVAIVLLDANTDNWSLAVAIGAVASVLLGWGTGQFGFALLAFLAIPFSVPFGYPDQGLGSEPAPIWWSSVFWAFISASLIFSAVLMKLSLAALLKSIVEIRRHRRASS